MTLVSKKYDKNHFCLLVVKSRTGMCFIVLKTPAFQSIIDLQIVYWRLPGGKISKRGKSGQRCNNP